MRGAPLCGVQKCLVQLCTMVGGVAAQFRFRRASRRQMKIAVASIESPLTCHCAARRGGNVRARLSFPNMRHCIAVAGLSLAPLLALAEVWEFPTNAWAAASVRTGQRHAEVVSAEGRVLMTVDAPSAHPSLEGVALTAAADGLHVDVSAAREKGLKALVLRVPAKGARAEGTAVTHLADWTGEDAAEVNLYCEGTVRGRHAFEYGTFVFGRRRRTFTQVVSLPAGLENLTLRYDLVKFGRTGRFVFHGNRVGRFDELPPTREPIASGAPVRTFYAAFDGTAEATQAGGEVRPSAAKGLSFAPGVCGQAVRLTAAAKSALAYAAPGNVSTRAGTVSFWTKREWPSTAAWRSLLAFPESGKRCGNGQVWLWWWDGTLRFDASDDARNWKHCRLPVDSAWHHVAVAWSDAGYRMYLDGRCLFDSSRDFAKDGTSPILRVLKGETLGHSFYDRVEPDRFFVGCKNGAQQADGLIDEFELWNGPLAEAEIVALSRRHAAAAKLSPPQKPDYAKLFAKDGPNRYEKPSAGVAPALDLELVETIRLDRAGVRKLTAAKRFRAVGDVAFKSLGATPYLECGRRQNDRVAVRFAVDPKDPLYVIDVDYPDDAKRTADIVVQGTRLAKSDGETGADYALQVGYFCGDECPCSNRIQTHRCLYWTCERDCAILLMTARADVPAAASEIRLYRVRDAKLPALAVAEPPKKDGWGRTFALYYEDPAIGYDFATRRSSGHDLDELSTMIDRTAAYMKFCGQNLFCYPGVWYQGRIGADRYNPRGHADDYLSAWYEKFDREGLFVVPNVNPNNMPISSEVLNVATLTDGSLHNSPIAIHDTGVPNWGGWHNTPPNFCFYHPDVQSNIESHVDALLAQGVGHPSFKGVCLHLTMHCMLWWGDLRSGYNDYVVEAFAKETGIDVPCRREGAPETGVSARGRAGNGSRREGAPETGVSARGRAGNGSRREAKSFGARLAPQTGDDPLRGRRYAEWIRENCRERWVQWRCDQVTRFYARLAAKLRAARPDLKLWFNSFIQPDFRQADFAAPGFMERQAREAGLDRAALAKIPNVILCQTAYPAFVRKRDRKLFPNDEAYAFNRVLQHQKGYNALLEGAAYPWVQLFDLYWENPSGRAKDGLSCDWLKECSWRVTTINPGGVHALRDFVIPLRHRDVLGFSKGGYLVGTYGMEEHLRRFAAAFRALPPVVMDDVGGDAFVKVRACTYEGRRYAYVVNTADEPRTFGAWQLGPYELRVLGDDFSMKTK